MDFGDEGKTLRKGPGRSTQIHIDVEGRLDIFGQRKSIFSVKVATLDVLPEQTDGSFGMRCNRETRFTEDWVDDE